MYEIIISGGLIMLPILLCSVISLAICLERLWCLQTRRVIPAHLVAQIWQLYKKKELNDSHLVTLRKSSPLGRVLAAGLVNAGLSREAMKESIDEMGRQVAHDLERYLNSLGTIASITPLLGLLGTVIGMIKVFDAIVGEGVGNPAVLAGGISEALITTASGLAVAIPTLLMYRYFSGRVNRLTLALEAEALKMVEVMYGEKEIASE